MRDASCKPQVAVRKSRELSPLWASSYFICLTAHFPYNTGAIRLTRRTKFRAFRNGVSSSSDDDDCTALWRRQLAFVRQTFTKARLGIRSREERSLLPPAVINRRFHFSFHHQAAPGHLSESCLECYIHTRGIWRRPNDAQLLSPDPPPGCSKYTRTMEVNFDLKIKMKRVGLTVLDLRPNFCCAGHGITGPENGAGTRKTGRQHC